MGWLDDLRKDPDGTHARLARCLYGYRVAAAFAIPFISERSEGKRQAIVPVETECPLLLLPLTVTNADEIVVTFPNGKRLSTDRSQLRRWRHVVALWVVDERGNEADLS